jgi:hypothetical protein
MKPVKAWAVFIKSDGMIDCDGAKPMVSLARKPMDETAQYCTTAKVVPVRIVPESEYRRMMAAVKVAEQACETGQNMMSHELWHLACKYYETRQKAKGKVNRGK